MNDKICLIGVNARYSHSNLAVRCLKNALDKHKIPSEIVELSINDRIEQAVDALYLKRADFYCFSCYIWNIAMIQEIISELKRLLPKSRIVLGGPEVSFDNVEFLKNPDVDYIICGEGEKALPALIKEPAGFPKEIRQEGCVDINAYSCLYESVPEHKIIYYETTRGCPFSCSYCLSSTIQGVRYKALEIVFSEIERLAAQGVRLIKFVDRTFNANAERALAIWKHLAGHYPAICFHFEVGADLLTPEQLNFLKTIPEGQFQFEIGIQSTNEETLKAVNRPWDKRKLFSNIQFLVQETQIHIHLDLIAGLPYEDFAAFLHSFDEVMSLRPHVLQVGFLKMLRGCRIREQAEKYDYVYSKRPPYTVYRNKFLSYDEILELKKIEKMVDKYYNSNCFMHSLTFILQQFEKPSDFYWKFGRYHEKNGFLERPVSRRELFRIFLDFYLETDGRQSELFCEILRLDYVLCEKSNPSWAQYRSNRDAVVKLLKNEKFKENYGRQVQKMTVEWFDFNGGMWLLFRDKQIINISEYINEDGGTQWKKF